MTQRVWKYINKTDTCWLWTGKVIDRQGYGRIFLGPRGDRRRVGAHRYMYEQLVGPIPDGLVLDHLCRVPLCVNPAHLEPVTQRENVLRGVSPFALNARKTHCKYGHPFSEANTFRATHGRDCRVCKARRAAEGGYFEKVCVGCGAAFVHRSNRVQFCSRSCAAIFNNRLRRERAEQ